MRLDRHRDAEFTLEGLSAAADSWLRALEVRAADGRVSATADPRTVRYYQTRGLIDRPVRHDGRRAVYGYRHLLQLLAVKGLQEEGQPLGLIESALAGRTTGELEAALTAAAGGGGEGAPAAMAEAGVARRLVCAEVAPGITVTVDPAVAGEAEPILKRAAESLSSFRERR